MWVVSEELSLQILRAHQEALDRGEDGYIDPHTGLFVMTAAALGARGECCGAGCRHCPYDEDEQRRAGRPKGLPRR